MSHAQRGDIFLVDLEPTRGGEIRKVRPCVVVSPNELNSRVNTLIIAPLTSGHHPYPFRLPCSLRGRDGHIVLDQIRTIDQQRLLRQVGALGEEQLLEVLAILREMFAP